MYEGQFIIKQDLIEKHWEEYLVFVKKKAQEERQRSEQRQKVLGALDSGTDKSYGNLVQSVDGPMPSYFYFDVSVNSFWQWYINEKVKA